MKNELFGKEDYEITVDDFKEKMDEALQTLIGIDVMANGGIGKLVSEAVKDVLFGNIEMDNTRCVIFCPALGDNCMEPFAQVYFTYKEDKRKRHGIGTRIESIELKYTIDISKVDKYIENISQILSYDKAKETKERLEEENKAHLEEIQKNQNYINQCENIMKYNAY